MIQDKEQYSNGFNKLMPSLNNLEGQVFFKRSLIKRHHYFRIFRLPKTRKTHP